MVRTSWPEATVPSFTHWLRMSCWRSSTVWLVRALVHGHRYPPRDTIALFESPPRASHRHGVQPARSARMRAEAPAPGRPIRRARRLGMANYGRIFRSRKDGGRRPAGHGARRLRGQAQKVGIVRAVPFGASNDEAAALLRDYPEPLHRARAHQRLPGHARRPRAGAAGAGGGLRGPRRLRAGRRHPRQRPALLSALHEGRRARHPRAHLLLHELRERPALRSRPPAPSRPGRHRLPRADPHRRARRLALGQRDGRARPPPPEAAHRHLRASREVSGPARLRAGRC